MVRALPRVAHAASYSLAPRRRPVGREPCLGGWCTLTVCAATSRAAVRARQSWLFEKSATWRRIVAATRASRGTMVAFTTACFVLPAALGAVIMGVRPARPRPRHARLTPQLQQTTPADEEARLRQLRQRAGLYGQMLAKVCARVALRRGGPAG